MVAFFTLLFTTTTTLFLACTHVLANPTPDNTGNSIPAFLARQLSPIDTTGIPSTCKPSCEAVSNGLSDCSTFDCICKDSNIDAIGSCFSCGVGIKDSGLDVKTAQGVVDEFVSACKGAGAPVKTTTISASGNGKNGAMRLGALGSGALGVVVLGALLSLA
ncbi:hypothetical protein Hypma_003988 [Hypsizygus marmoreus]|uniref:Extracellular membrane protein CFEM domain-containing protein n=1 Tax=Hypsizygus marmoreus TaxID=39966 RepID=A0A369J7H4_HYPMA|nr:hypothetical protein Hypma_003988 [Hypsizygus marmoreus]